MFAASMSTEAAPSAAIRKSPCRLTRKLFRLRPHRSRPAPEPRHRRMVRSRPTAFAIALPTAPTAARLTSRLHHECRRDGSSDLDNLVSINGRSEYGSGSPEPGVLQPSIFAVQILLVQRPTSPAQPLLELAYPVRRIALPASARLYNEAPL